MFDQLFRCSSAVERHLAGRLAEPRLRFLTHLAKQGTAHSTLMKKAHHLLVIVNQMKLQEEGVVRLEDIQAAAHV